MSLVNAAIADENDISCWSRRLAGRSASRTTEIRVFKSRGSTGVRGIRWVRAIAVSMSIIRHFEADPAEREAYLKKCRLMAGAGVDEVEAADEEEAAVEVGQLSTERYAGGRGSDPDLHHHLGFG